MIAVKFETVFCDDVRQELNGKYILIGVYSSDLVPAAMPSKFNIAIWSRVTGLPSGQHRFAARLVPPGEGAAITRVEGEGSNGDIPFTLAVSGLPVDLRGFGEIQFYISFDGQPEVLAGSLPVRPLNKPPAPPASP